MYEVPFFAVTSLEGTRFHDFESKTTITNKPTVIAVLTPAIRARLQEGGLKETDASGKVLSHKSRTNPTISMGNASPAEATQAAAVERALAMAGGSARAVPSGRAPATPESKPVAKDKAPAKGAKSSKEPTGELGLDDLLGDGSDDGDDGSAGK